MLKISKAQIAHLISAPLVAALTVGAAWLAQHFPGLPGFNTEEVTGFAGLVGVSAAGFALHYLKGLREWELAEAKGWISTEEEPAAAELAEPPETARTPDPAPS